jgi:hypothetical protein
LFFHQLTDTTDATDTEKLSRYLASDDPRLVSTQIKAY